MPAYLRTAGPIHHRRTGMCSFLLCVAGLVGPSFPARAQVERVQVTLQGWWRGETNGFASSLAHFGSYVALANGKAGVEILDISNPTAPGNLANHASPGEPARIVVAANRAYVVGRSNGLEVLDLSDPVHPVRTGHFGPGRTFGGVAVQGSYAYVSASDQNRSLLTVLDVSNPAQIKEMGALPFSTNAFPGVHEVKVEGELAYVGFTTENSGGICVIDVTDPARPMFKGRSIDPGVTPYDLAVTGGYAWVADPVRGLRVADVRSPTNPSFVGRRDVNGTPWGIRVAGKQAYLASGIAGVQVYDIASPTAPSWVGGATGPGVATGISLSGETVYVAAGTEGLLVYATRDLPAVIGYAVGPGDTFTLSWNPLAEGMTLQRATDAALSSWADIPGSETTNRIEIQMAAPVGIFRLVRP